MRLEARRQPRPARPAAMATTSARRPAKKLATTARRGRANGDGDAASAATTTGAATIARRAATPPSGATSSVRDHGGELAGRRGVDASCAGGADSRGSSRADDRPWRQRRDEDCVRRRGSARSRARASRGGDGRARQHEPVAAGQRQEQRRDGDDGRVAHVARRHALVKATTASAADAANCSSASQRHALFAGHNSTAGTSTATAGPRSIRATSHAHAPSARPRQPHTDAKVAVPRARANSSLAARCDARCAAPTATPPPVATCRPRDRSRPSSGKRSAVRATVYAASAANAAVGPKRLRAHLAAAEPVARLEPARQLGLARARLGRASYSQRTSGGSDIRIDSVRPSVLRPKMVPRS